MRILYMGTPLFAAKVLDGICDVGHEVVGVISQPDKPKNRGMQMLPTPVKEAAEKRGIPVYQPETLRDKAILPYLENIKPDIIVVVAYGKLLPQYVLDFPPHGCINMHASLLPKYRGAAPIQWAIINGETETGVTSMFMEKGLDTGDMILREKVLIADSDTSDSLHDKLIEAAIKVANETLSLFKKGEVPREKQNDAESSYAPLLTKEMGLVDFKKTTKEILNQIRGLSPWPGAYAYNGEQRFKILEAKSQMGNGTPGEVLENAKRLVIATGDGAIEIVSMQFAGKRAMSGSAAMQGNRIELGTILGE